MLLSARVLEDVSTVNNFKVAADVEWTEGDPVTFYIQLIDASVDTAKCGYNPPGRRYMPAAGATLEVVFENIDDSKEVTKTATNPFATDTSIWAISILSSNTIRGTPQMRLTLTESTVVRRGVVKNAIRIHPNQNLE
jgi:hypothetical protein